MLNITEIRLNANNVTEKTIESRTKDGKTKPEKITVI